MNFTVKLLPSAERLLVAHAAELPQKDDFCGAFWATLALKVAGVDADQDAAALAAGTAISAFPRDEDRPKGAQPRRDYRLPVQTTDDTATAGTSAAGVAESVESLSAGATKVIPIAGPWAPSTVEAVLEMACTAGVQASIIANVGTQHLWSSHAPLHAVLHQLVVGDVQPPPRPDWAVGHFVGLAGVVRGPADTFVVVLDTYRELGDGGIHLQPISAVAAACHREGSRPGGLLLTVPSSIYSQTADSLRRTGLSTKFWDNGSPSDQP